MIKQLIPVLRENGWDVSLEDILDLLWLAEHLPPNQRDFSERADLPKLNGQSPEISPATPKDESLLPGTEFIVDGKTIRSNVSGGGGLISPGTATLPLNFKGKKHSHSIERLGISRSLWPLRMLALKQKGNELDEAITSENIADALSYQIDTWIPEFLLERISWFDLIVIIDVATSMLLWKRVTDEFRQLLEHYGNFRNKHLLYINSDLQGDLFLNYSADPSIIKKTQLSRINAEAGRTSVIVVTDCVGKAWRDGRLPDYLSTHGKKFQTTIAQVLPAHLWGLTALKKAERIYLSPVFPGQPNHQIMSRDNRSNLILKRLKRSRSIPFPCISMKDYSVAAWAKALAGMPGQVVPGFSFTAPNDDSDKPMKEAQNEFTVLVTPNDETDKPIEEVVNEFYARTTPSAVRLARYLAFSNGSFDIQLVEAMMHEFFRDSDRSIAFEVLLSHLIKIELVDKAISFRFREGIQDFLLYGVTQTEAEDVAKVLFALADRDGNNSIDISKVTEVGAEISKEQLDSIWNVIRFLNNHRARASKLVSSLNIKDSDRSKYFSWAEDSWNKGEWDNARSKYKFFLSQYDAESLSKFVQKILNILDKVQELSEKVDRLLSDLKPEQTSELLAAMTELWKLADGNSYVREQDRKVQKITQQLRKTEPYIEGFNDLFILWAAGSNREVLAQLGGLADKRNPRQGEAKRLERWLSDLVDKTRRAEMAYNENNLEEARSHIDAVLQIPSIDEWRDTYTPLQDLLNNDELKVEEVPSDEDLKGSGFGKPLILEGDEGDIETKKTQHEVEIEFDTFREDVESRKYKWPEEFEKFALNVYATSHSPKDSINQLIESEFPKYLQQHYEFLGQEMNDLDHIVSQRGLEHLQEIQKRWQPYLDDKSRLNKYSATPILDTVYKRVQNIIALIPIYGQATELLNGIDAVKREAVTALKQRNGYLEAMQGIEECLQSAPSKTEPVMDLVGDKYDELKEFLQVLEEANLQSLAEKQGWILNREITIDDVVRIQKSGNLSLAEKYMEREDVSNIPGAKEVLQSLWKAREETNTLLKDAEYKREQLAFSEAETLYKQVLKIDKGNYDASRNLLQIEFDLVRLAKIDNLLEQVGQELDIRNLKNAIQRFGQASELDNMDWRKQQRKLLKTKIDDLRANALYNFDTFREDVEKGKYKWPEDFERFILEMYVTLDRPRDEITQRIEGEFPKYLQQHYEFLGQGMNNLPRKSVYKGLEYLHEIQTHWQPYVDDRSRLGRHTSSNLLEAVYKRVQNIVELVPIYERAAELLQKIDAAKEEAEAFLNQEKGYLDAVKILESCLQSTPPESDPVYDLLRDDYEEIEKILKGFQDI